jgi:ornithine cyclodeaminase/alanine dehydrogenase-like protein (mu-crystallin family)
MLILNETEIRDLTSAAAAHEVVRDAFRVLHRGEATLPQVISLPFAAPEGIAHIKAGHLHADEVWTVKVSTDHYRDDGGPTLHGGLMLVLSAVDGGLAGVLVDNGYLTDLRTGGAGAVAADLLAREDATTVAIVGAGNQARFQLEALLQVRQLETVHVVSRSVDRARAFVDEVEARWHLSMRLFESVQDAVGGADVVITTTPSSAPLLRAGWLEAGVHVTAVGSDEPTKQELDPDVLRRADVIAVDDRSQAARFGELHHALDAGFVQEADVVTLGELLEGTADGRRGREDVTVADLTGVGVQDAAIAAFVLREAVRSSAARLGARE